MKEAAPLLLVMGLLIAAAVAVVTGISRKAEDDRAVAENRWARMRVEDEKRMAKFQAACDYLWSLNPTNEEQKALRVVCR